MMNLLIVGVQVGLNLGSFQLFSISTLAVTLADLSMILFIIGAVIKVTWSGEALYIHKNSSLFFLCGIFIAAIISGVTPILNGDPGRLGQFLKTFSHFLYLWLFTFACATLRIDMKVWTNVIKVMLVFAVFVNIFGIYQIVARAFDWPFAWLSMTNISISGRGSNISGDAGQLSLNYGNFYRATSIFSEPSSLAGFNVNILTYLLVPFALGIKQFFTSRFFIAIAFISSVAALFLTFSLTGVFTGTVIFSSILIFGERKRRMQVVTIILTGALLIIITDSLVRSYADISVLDLFTQRISGIADGGKTKETTGGESFFTRLESIVLAVEIWADHPGNGIGLGLYAKAPQAIRGGYGFPDSTLAAALSEMGITGFIFMAGMLVTLSYKTMSFSLSKVSMAKISLESRRIIAIVPYTLLLLTAGTFTNNSLVNLWLWIGFSMGFAVYFEVLRESGNMDFIRFRFVKIPLRTRFLEILDRHPAVSSKS